MDEKESSGLSAAVLGLIGGAAGVSIVVLSQKQKKRKAASEVPEGEKTEDAPAEEPESDAEEAAEAEEHSEE